MFTTRKELWLNVQVAIVFGTVKSPRVIEIKIGRAPSSFIYDLYPNRYC